MLLLSIYTWGSRNDRFLWPTTDNNVVYTHTLNTYTPNCIHIVCTEVHLCCPPSLYRAHHHNSPTAYSNIIERPCERIDIGACGDREGLGHHNQVHSLFRFNWLVVLSLYARLYLHIWWETINIDWTMVSRFGWRGYIYMCHTYSCCNEWSIIRGCNVVIIWRKKHNNYLFVP